MKKLVLLLAVTFSVSLFSCGGAKTEAAATETDTVAADTVVVDSCCAAADSCVATDSVAA